MTEEITDEALDAAAADAPADNVLTDDVQTDDNVDVVETADADNIDVVDEQIDELQAEDIPDEPEDHGERSQLGRKVGDNYRELMGELEQVKRELDSFKQGVQSVQPQAIQQDIPSFDPNEEIPHDMTWGQMEKWQDERDQRKRQLEEQDMIRYESGYREKFSKLTQDIDEKEAEAIETEMLANFNVRHYNDPTLDAERNFLRAENAVLRNRPPEKPQTNLRQGKPTGGKSGTTTAQRKAGAVKLDPIAAEFVAELKKNNDWSDEDVSKALEGETPSHLMGGSI